MASPKGFVKEHRRIVHDAGIDIPPGHHVDHINGNPGDNRLENLQVLSPQAHHKKTQADWKRYLYSLEEQVATYQTLYGPLDGYEDVVMPYRARIREQERALACLQTFKERADA